MFKVFTVLCASLAFAQAGLLAAAPAQLHYSPANEVSHVYNSIEAISHHQPLVAQGLKYFLKSISSSFYFC